MNGHDQSGSKGLYFKRRVPIETSAMSLVKIDRSSTSSALPVIIHPVNNTVDLFGWAAIARSEITTILLRDGAILFRGFDVKTETEFQKFIQVVSGDPLPYEERSSPRTQIQGHIYTSTDHPPEQPIFLHCENSYRKTWPLKIFFYCHVQPEHGGETPIADTRGILKRIRPEVRDVFAQKGIMYVRNFGSGLGLAWETVFQTTDREEVEHYCHSVGMECIWHGSDRLTTRQVRNAIRKHPVTGDELWFNHAVFFHFSTLDSEVQKSLREVLADDEMPNNTYYGDGKEIEPEILEHLKAAYAEETIYFPWTKGDILMLDNMLVAHGRSPYKGKRKILVGMTEPYSE